MLRSHLTNTRAWLLVARGVLVAAGLAPLAPGIPVLVAGACGAVAGAVLGVRMSYHWWVVSALALTSPMLRVLVPLAVGGRDSPRWLRNALLHADPALLAGLVVMLLWPTGADVPAVRTLTALAGVARVCCCSRRSGRSSPRWWARRS